MKLFTRILLFTGILLHAACVLLAQTSTHTVRGKILDSKDNTGVIGVTVAELDKDSRVIKGAISDVEGNFVIQVSNPNNTLSFSSIGYKTQKVAIGGRAVINIKLESEVSELDEVVVTAKPTTDNGLMSVSERNTTIAVAKIDAKAVEDMQGTSIDQMLQGRLAGVDITAANGNPGAGMQIRIRGTSSINSSADPMIVVDGMPYETSIPSDFNFGTADELGYASLLNLAPSDIKNISILKDAAATAMWGSRAANGVVVINTKRGALGAPKVTYTFKGSLSKQPNSIPMLTGDQYSMLIPEEVMNRNGVPLNTQTTKEFLYDPNDPYWYKNYGQNTDWISAITQTGYAQDHFVSLAGGGEKAKYYASLGYFNQKGTTIGTALDRITARINLDYNVSTRIRFRTDLSFTHSLNDRNYLSSLTGNKDLVRSVAYAKMPNMGIYEYNDLGNLTGNYFSPLANIQGGFATTYNPVAMVNSAKNRILSERIIPHFQVQYDLKPGEWISTFDVQFDINNNKTNTFLPQIATGQPLTSSSVNVATDSDIDVFALTTKTTLIYTPKIKNTNHDLTSLWALNTANTRAIWQEAYVTNTASSDLTDASNPARLTTSRLSSGLSMTRNVGLLWNIHYGFMNRYIVDVGLRGDGNSRLGPDYRYGLFPSVSAKWIISDESFMKPFESVLDMLGFRVSYGQSGNVPKYDYLYYGTYGTLGWSYLGSSAVVPTTMQLNNLRWERIIGRNFGINLITKNRKINIDAEFYNNSTKDLFFDKLQIPAFTGFNQVQMNVGTLDNKGWEVNVAVTPYKDKDWSVDFNMNVAHNVNVIREISDLYPRQAGTGTINGEYRTFLQVNNPFGSFYGYKYLGVYKDKDATIAKGRNGEPIITPDGQSVYMRFNYPSTDYVFQPGDAMYEDINHDGNINYLDIVYLGNSNPAFTGGFGGSVAYKSWRLTTFFNFRSNYDVVNATRMNLTNMYGFSNQSTEVLSRWRQEGDITNVPRAVYNTGYNWLGSSRYVEDASFLRFRTATLSYTFSPNVLKQLRITALRTYATVENILTWTKYSGQDPEVQMRGSDPFRVATDYSMTPPSKTVTFGLSATF
jgi:TonB-linked SusC/RagA family outer membrane protein